MSRRHILDFRVGNPWSPRSHSVLHTSSETAWGDPMHPGSEGRRSAIWREAARASVAALTGFPYVRFVRDRRAAYAHLADLDVRLAAAPATHRRLVLRRATLALPVDDHGTWSCALPDSGWLAFQAANDETGVIDALPHNRQIVLDADVTLGRVPVTTRADIVVADSRAWGSPIDLAFVLSHEPLDIPEPVQVPELAVAVDALTLAMEAMAARSAAESAAMDALEQRLVAVIPDVQFHGQNRVGHIRSFSVLHLDAETLMRALDEAGYVVGSGSACAQDGSPSDVLAAMGRITHGNVRLALPVGIDLAVLDVFAEDLAAIVARLRRDAGVDDL